MPAIKNLDAQDRELVARFAAAVRRRRQELGFSQDELSQRSGLARSYITEVERTNRNIHLINVGRLARALEIPVWELLKYAAEDYNS